MRYIIINIFIHIILLSMILYIHMYIKYGTKTNSPELLRYRQILYTSVISGRSEKSEDIQ